MECENFDFGDWRFTCSSAKTILPSVDPCKSANNRTAPSNTATNCDFCAYSAALQSLPQWPEMIFAKNRLTLHHKPSGARLDFNCLDALRLVNTERDWVKVFATEEWTNSRSQCKFIKNTVKSYDWTYSTNYAGTLSETVKIFPTNQRIDMKKLAKREKILFYQEMTFYEDELADNGCSCLTLKFRCMPNSFFCLLRFFLRVDKVLVKIVDTRVYWEIGFSNYLIRETSCRSKLVKDMNQAEKDACYTKPNEIYRFLDLIEDRVEKIVF